MSHRLSQVYSNADASEAASLRHDTTKAMLTGLGYNERESFALLDQFSFRWAQGNLSDNVAAIRALPNPSDLATRKYNTLMECGEPSSKAEASLELLRDAPHARLV